MMPKRVAFQSRPKCHEPGVYRVRVVGQLGPEWGDRFDGVELVSGRQADGTVTTELTGEFADQAALVGLVEQLAAVGASLLHLELVRAVPPAGTAGKVEPSAGSRKSEIELDDEVQDAKTS